MSPENLACPQCSAIDMARHVSAIVWEGHSGIAMHGTYAGLAGLTPTIGTSSHFGRVTSDLAVALSPPPPPPSRAAWFGWIATLVMVAVCLGGFAALAASTRLNADAAANGTAASAGFAVLATAVVAVIVLLVVLLVRRLRQDRRWRQAMPDMTAVWNTARYCARCAIAYFPSTVMPPPLPSHIDPGNFRGVVWQAGLIHSRQRRASENVGSPPPVQPETTNTV